VDSRLAFVERGLGTGRRAEERRSGPDFARGFLLNLETGPFSPATSREERFNDFAGDVGEAKVAALEAVGEAQVIEAEEVEDCGVEIVDMHRVARDVPADLEDKERSS